MRDAELTLSEAQTFVHLVRRETGWGTDGRPRQIEEQIRRWDAYEQTPTELEQGARVAWRNSARRTSSLRTTPGDRARR